MKVFTALILVFTAYIVVGPKVQAASIKDVKPSHWAYKPIQKYVDNGYATLEEGCFYPNKAITRGEMAQMLVNTLRLPLDATVDLQAKDLTQEHPNFKALHKLIELGVFNNSEYIHPDNTLTRAQMAKVIAIAFHVEVDNKNKTSFKDYSKSYWAKPYIESLADEKIITGKTATQYAPNDNVTKAHFVALASRAKNFSSRVKNLEIAYDLLSKAYINTKQVNRHYVSEVIDIVNKERAALGLQPVQEDVYLSQLATVKLNDIVNRKYFDHYSPYYGYPWEMANYFDYEFRSFGENLAKNLVTPKSVMKGWMASPKHKENILKPNYTNIGIAVKRDGIGNFIWVQMFSSK